MPVPFKGESEYDAKFRWLDSVKSATCHLAPEQEAPRAGLGSANLGLPIEPPIQRKKKPFDIEPTETTKFTAGADDADSYVLLGDQSKFGQSVRYRSLKNKSPSRKTYKVFKHDRSPSAEVRRPVSPPRKPESDPGSPPPAPRPDGPRQSRPRPEPSKRSKSSPPPERRRSPSPPVPKRSKSPPPAEPARMNAFVQTNMTKGRADSGMEATADYGMKYRAGVAPKRPEGPKRVSEYKKAFEWRDPVQVAPLLAAEQLVYKSDSSLGPYKSNVQRKSEYESEFKKFAPRPAEPSFSPKKGEGVGAKKDEGPSPNKKTKVTEVVKKPAKKRHPTEEDKKDLKEAVNPQKPFMPHGKHRRTKSEYASNFQAPAAYSYNEGAWKGAYPAHIFPQKETAEPTSADSSSSWFQEVLELRRRALEYRKRAYGTHFSRSHVGQLMAKNADMWDTASESTRTVTAMSLETGSQVSSRKGPHRGDAQRDQELQDVKKKLAWTQTKQRRDQSPPSVSQQGSVTGSASNGSSIITRDSQVAHASDSDTLVDEEIGRIPTPRLRQEVRSARRHHLDITTPSVGGALLVSPPPVARQQNYESPNVSLREEPSKHSSGRSPPEECQDESDDDDDDDRTPTPPPRRVAPKQRDISSQTRVVRPRKTVSAPVIPRPESHCSCGADDEPPIHSKKTYKKSYKVSPRSVPSPTFGKPTDDNCPLVDEEASTDRPLETEFIKSLPFGSANTKTKRSSTAQQKRASRMSNVAIPSTIKEGFGETYGRGSRRKEMPWDMFGNKPDMLPREDDDDDDVLSTSMRSIASSCSLASETLQRAAKNRDDFWGGRKGATVR
ncbi:nuclear protein MDM1-like isoform X2 [Lineus longissimus]|uniref:nuclear protein MDM1-like isoform X2 n=1 Tax=Lineus longissimus TaxID=88925 RepID=UPI00315DAE01